MATKTKKPSDADPSRVRRCFYREGPYGEEEYVLEASSLVWAEYDSVKERLTQALKEVETLKAERTATKIKIAEAEEMLRSVTEALALGPLRPSVLEHGPYCTKFELRAGHRVFCAELAGHADACEFERGT